MALNESTEEENINYIIIPGPALPAPTGGGKYRYLLFGNSTNQVQVCSIQSPNPIIINGAQLGANQVMKFNLSALDGMFFNISNNPADPNLPVISFTATGDVLIVEGVRQ